MGTFKYVDDKLLNYNKQLTDTIRERENITDTTPSLSSFQFNNNCYKQEEGLMKGAPSSTILLQFLEGNTFVRYKTMGTFKYVDDKLLNYNKQLTDTNLILQEFNNIQPNLLFSM
jgi:hypothetical protein